MCSVRPRAVIGGAGTPALESGSIYRRVRGPEMLNQEIDNAQRLVKTDAYQLSIGEVVNMYRNGEFVINPDFQRLFRWEIGQKARLIESLLLGIPIPSIFVFERETRLGS